MIECPKCQHQFEADFGMVACPQCGNFVVLDVDGNIQQDLTSMGISRPVEEPDFQTAYTQSNQQADEEARIPEVAEPEDKFEAAPPEEDEIYDQSILKQISQAQEPAPETVIYEDPQAVVEESVQASGLEVAFESPSGAEEANPMEPQVEEFVYEEPNTAYEESDEEPEQTESFSMEEDHDEEASHEVTEEDQDDDEYDEPEEHEYGESEDDEEDYVEEDESVETSAGTMSKSVAEIRERPVANDDWVNEQDQGGFAPEDMSEIESYGNSELSMAKDGQYLYDLRISGIDTSDIKQEVYEMMTDRRLALNMKGLIKTVTDGVLEVQRLNAIKTSIIVNRLKSLPVLLQWRQNVITQVDPE